jgi:hypothetical protein
MIRVSGANRNSQTHRCLGQISKETRRPIDYDLFGLSFRTAIPIPGVQPAPALAAGSPAICIDFGPVPLSIGAPCYKDSIVQVTGDEYLFHYPGLVRLYVQGGERIVVEAAPDADPVKLWTITLGVGASIAGFRRGHVPIHASAILTSRGCMAFAGQSGAGKSTTAAWLLRLGYQLHADDLCLANVSGDEVVVGRGIQELRLWDESIQALGWEDVQPFALMPDVPKSVFRWAAPSPPLGTLRRMYVLKFADEAAEPGIYAMEGVQALQALIDCLRLRPRILSTGLAGRTFEHLTTLCRKVEMFRFVRPLDVRSSEGWTRRLAEHFYE